MDYVSCKTERELEKSISDLVRKGELKFHSKNKRTNTEVPPFPGRSDLVRGFLTRSIDERLGCGKDSLQKQIMPHPYFKGIDWTLVDAKKLSPPYKPAVPYN
jgi:hypothetical protein